MVRIGGQDLEMVAGDRGRTFCANLPRPGRFHVPSGCRTNEYQYPRPMTWGYEGPDCLDTVPGDSLRVPCGDALGAQPGTAGAHEHMNHPLVVRAWRVCVTLGPIVAIALTLVAGRRW